MCAVLGFAVRRPPVGVASPRSHPRGCPLMPQDAVACRVHVRVRLLPAAPAAAAADGLTLPRRPIPGPAGVAGLRRPRRIDLLDPVLTPVDLPGLHPGDLPDQPGPPLRSPSGSGEATLQPDQSGRLTGAQPGAAQQLPGAQRRRHRHTPVDPDDPTGPRGANRVGHRGERDMPATRTIPRDPVGPGIRNGAATAKPDPAHLGDPHLRPAAVDLPHITRPDRDDPEPLTPPAPTPRRPPMRTTEKVRPRGGKIPQRLLLHDHTPSSQPVTRAPRRGQLPVPLGVTGSGATPRVPPRLLLHTQVPHEPRMPTMHQKSLFLCHVGIQPEPRHQPIPTHRDRGEEGPEIPGRPAPPHHRNHQRRRLFPEQENHPPVTGRVRTAVHLMVHRLSLPRSAGAGAGSRIPPRPEGRGILRNSR
ncbi:hypothetical protein FF36_03313 [Frankia torreyi]|uniref:Uncharacterized protein n=1 Tax=Frankia torreyi TaxID=1856 RepID=A0A0D8BE23_9ACTN|nr:hypothetical protein FF36_03313 [Frankia torreyi]